MQITLTKLPLNDGGFRYARLTPSQVRALASDPAAHLAYALNQIDLARSVAACPTILEDSAVTAIENGMDAKDAFEAYGVHPLFRLSLRAGYYQAKMPAQVAA